MADRLADDQLAGIFERPADAFPAGHLAHAGMAGALSRRMTILRVKKGPCAPDRFSSMLSCPATGTTVSSVTTGVAGKEAPMVAAAVDWDSGMAAGSPEGSDPPCGDRIGIRPIYVISRRMTYHAV